MVSILISSFDPKFKMSRWGKKDFVCVLVGGRYLFCCCYCYYSVSCFIVNVCACKDFCFLKTFFFLKEFLYFYYLFIYLFISGRVGSSPPCRGFL